MDRGSLRLNYKRQLRPFRMAKPEGPWTIAACLIGGLIFAAATFVDWWPVQASAFGLALLVFGIDLWRNRKPT